MGTAEKPVPGVAWLSLSIFRMDIKCGVQESFVRNGERREGLFLELCRIQTELQKLK